MGLETNKHNANGGPTYSAGGPLYQRLLLICPAPAIAEWMDKAQARGRRGAKICGVVRYVLSTWWIIPRIESRLYPQL